MMHIFARFRMRLFLFLLPDEPSCQPGNTMKYCQVGRIRQLTRGLQTPLGTVEHGEATIMT